jgi:hypothetical protein
VVVNAVRSRLSAPATTLPSELVSVTFWNQPSVTSTLTGAVGDTSSAESAGSNFIEGAAAADCSPVEGSPDRVAQAARAPGATTPTARAVKARRLLIDGIGSAGLTWTKRT